MKRLAVCAGALAALVLLLAAASASAATICCGNFRTPGQLALSRDGRFVYVSDRHTTLALRRNLDTGAVAALDAYDGGGTMSELSPDGRFLYVASRNWMGVFARDRESGRLGGASTAASVRSLVDIAISADGRQLYATDYFGLKVFSRDVATGTLSLRKTFTDGVGGVELADPAGIDLSPDGRFLYVAVQAPWSDGTGISQFARAADGSLSYVGKLVCGCAPRDPEITRDGALLYGGGRMAFPRDNQSGALAEYFAAAPWYNVPDATYHDGGLAFSPDGRAVYGVDHYEDSLGQAAVGAQWFDEKTYRDGDDGMKGLRAPASLAVSPDGRFVIVAGGGSWSGDVPATIATFRRNAATNDLTFASMAIGTTQDGRPTGAPPPSISINDGAAYTNDPHVTLTLDLPNYGPQIAVANDGGFGGSTLFTWAYRKTVPWTLASTGPDRLPKTVYARSVPANGYPDVYTDEIVLDETAPVVVSAQATAHVLRVKARDGLSGVAKVQIAADRKHPGAWRSFVRGKDYAVGDGRPYVRVRDRARNLSSWRRTVR